LGQGLPLHLHPGERLELGNVLLEHVDERVLGQEQEELLALEALPVEALGAGRSEDERPGGDAGGEALQEGAARQAASGRSSSPLDRGRHCPRWAHARRHRSALWLSAQEHRAATPAILPAGGAGRRSPEETIHALPCIWSDRAASVGAGLRLLADGRRPLWS